MRSTTPLRRAATLTALASLVLMPGYTGPATARTPGAPAATGSPALHYSGKPLINPLADLSALAAIGAAAADASDVPGADARTAQRFNTWSGYATVRFPEAVATGDFDADGAIDVAFVRGNGSSEGMAVQFNAGGGTLRAPVTYASTAESSDIKAGDLDGDMDLDLVVASEGTSLSNTVIDLYFNNGKGVFTRRTTTGGIGPLKMTLADLDSDDDLDIAVSSSIFGETMSVVLNRGDGTFGAEKRYAVGKNPKGIAAADFDGDGDGDLAVAIDDPETLLTRVEIWANNGSGKFAKAKAVTLIQQGDPSLVTDDFNGDGKPDLAVGMVGTDNQVVMLNKGKLAFDQTVYATGFSAWDLASGDLDGDGDVDIVLATVGSSSTGDVSILRNRGHGTFDALRFLSGFNPHDAAIADLNGDKKADIVVAQGGTQTGSVHLQRPGFNFDAPPLAETTLPISSVENSDFDHDDDIDLALSVNDPFGGIGYVQMMTNGGKANFQTGQLIDGGLTSDGHVGHVQPADVNGDGWDDLVWNIAQFSEPVGAIVISINKKGVFGAPTVFPGTARNDYTAVADLDGDGDLDLASAQFTEQIAVYLNNGKGKFGAAQIHPVGEFPGMIVARDLSGDGKADLVTVHNGVYGSSKTISVLIGTGGAKFAKPVMYTVGQGPLEVVATDLDNDGDLDLATSNNGGDDISVFADETTTVLLNKGTGKFDQIRTYAGEAVGSYLSEWAIAAADFDGDGNNDIAVTNVLGNNAGIYYGKGDGTLAPQSVRYGLQNGALDMAAADYNDDGWVDIAAAGYLAAVDPFYPPPGIVVLKNQGRRAA